MLGQIKYCVKGENLFICPACQTLTLPTIIMTVMAAELVRASRSESKGEPERLR